MPKTKIICTLGPATDDEAVLRQLVESGMDIARFNFSHGTHAEQHERLALLKKVCEETGIPVSALMDTKGPEIRTGMIENGSVELHAGQSFTLTTDDCLGNAERCHVTYADLPKDVHTGDRIMIDDGKISMTVQSLTGTDIVCTVENDAPLRDQKSINVPGGPLSMPYISKTDYDDLIFAAHEGYDFIAASFVRSADDVKEVRMLLGWNGGEHMKIISKIECVQGVENFDEILEASDGIMVARGDLGAGLPLEDVPVIQKELIHKVYKCGKPVITATQMLETMMSNPRPTRAEATDIANAIYDGTSAIMLSGETAAGKYPVQALQTMVRIAARAEQAIDYTANFRNMTFYNGANITHAVCRAACTSAMDLGAKAILAFTLSGFTAQQVSAFRPDCRVIACTSSELTCRQLRMTWGVEALFVKDEENLDDLFASGIEAVVEHGMLQKGDMVVLTAGVPIGVSGSTNFIKVTHV